MTNQSMKTKYSEKDEPDEPAAHRVLIVDDHPFLRLGLAEALGREPGLCVCGTVGTAEDALTAVETLRPAVVVADLNLPGKSGLELIKDLATLRPGLPVIVLSMHDEDVYAERCLRAGGRGYVMKSEGPEKLANVIRLVLAGGTHVSAKTTERIIETFAGRGSPDKRSSLAALSDREFEIFQLIGRGLPTQGIADRLHISAKTVETHRMHVKAKLRIATAAELIAFAARWVSVGE
jgi:DNA-binding NarL/FixJ family response regulator